MSLTLIACGFAVCADLPLTTELLARATSGSATTPFSKDQLVQAALATRDYTIGSHNKEQLALVLIAINTEANTPYAYLTTENIEEAPEAYTLTPEALSHLDDVYEVVTRVTSLLGSAALVCLCASALITRLYGLRNFGRVLCIASSIVLSALCFCGLWAMLDFTGLFSVFHSLFFAAGTWVFSSESLLITMYPSAFWIGMGTIWFAVSMSASILTLISGILLCKKARTTLQQTPRCHAAHLPQGRCINNE